MLCDEKYQGQWTIIDAIEKHVKEHEKNTVFTFINEKGNVVEQISFGNLYHQVLHFSERLNNFSLHHQAAILMLPNNAHFIRAFLSCIYLGCISIPIPPPQGKRHFTRFKTIIEHSGAKVMITNKDIFARISMSEIGLFEKLNITVILTDDLYDAYATSIISSHRQYNETAFLQYTSGSTAQPKGVIVSNQNIYTNEQQITKAFRHDKSSVVVGWLPFYHDMGLIGNILQPLFTGIHSILFSPTTFLQSPQLWLKTISQYKATTSGGPNFAYQHCINKINKNDIQDIDLSHWKTAFNGAEMINSDTLNHFAKYFSDLGFNAKSLFTCYGMAEATLFVTGRHYSSEENIQSYVNCGNTYDDTRFIIVNPETHKICSEEEIGEIWLTGESIASGYWHDETNTLAFFKAKILNEDVLYLRTGDLGFCKNHSLYVTGRIKELLIVRGRNYSPFDIEIALKAENSELTHARMAILSNEHEQIIILIETGKTEFSKLNPESTYLCAQAVLGEQFQLDLDKMIFVRHYTLPRTTSGKLQYYACRNAYLENRLYTLGVFSKDIFFEMNVHDANDFKQKLTEIVSGILGYPQDKIDTSTPLIHYGIDSLKAVEITHAISREFNDNIRVEDILSGISLDFLVENVRPQQPNHLHTIQTVVPQETPLTWQQQSIWIWQKLNPSNHAYLIPVLLEVEGQYDCERFRSVLTLLASMHPILKARFILQSNSVMQYLDPAFEPAITQTDVEESMIDSLLPTIIYDECDKVLQRSNMPSWRIHIIKLAKYRCKILFVFHHIIIDGWSMNILVKDFVSLYQGNHTGIRAPDYFTYANLQNEVFHQDESYWINYVGEKPPVYTLTHYQNRQRLQKKETPHYAEFKINKIKLNQLRNFIHTHQLTMSQLLLAVYHILLQKHSSERKTLIGYPCANRGDSQYAETVGCFVNTLVNKVEFNTDTTILDVIQQVKQGLLQATHHETYPFQALVQALHIEKHQNISPIFQCFFVVQNAVHHFPENADFKVTVLPQPTVPSMYDLVLEIRYEEDEIVGKFEFNASISKILVSHFIEYYQSVLDKVLIDPESKITRLYKDEASFESEVIHNHDISSVVELFEHQVALHPNNIAIQSDTSFWTYQLLNENAARLAATLKTKSLKKGDHVMLALSRSPWMIAALLAIQKIGAIYIPVDIHYPDDRLNGILQLCKPKAIILDETLSSVFDSIPNKISVHHLENIEEKTYSWTKGNHDLNDTAYIIMTSGTSGDVKGVEVQSSSLINFTLAAIDLFHLSHHDKVLQFSSLSWDTSSEEIYPTLLSGACLVLRSHQPIESYANLIKLIHEYHVTVCNLPSSYWQELYFYMRDHHLSCPASLRLIIVGGEPVSYSTLIQWFNKMDDRIEVLNTYGSTEATSISTACSLNDVIKQDSSYLLNMVPIGKPISGVRLYILDDNLNPVPPGVSGQLFIAGKGLAKGYLENDMLSQNKFIYLTNPQGEVERVFATGDVAFYSFEKNIFLLGRNDKQIKRRGIRIQLSEIESVLLQHPFIANLVIEVQNNKQQIIAYVVLKNSIETDMGVKSIHEFLRSKLPRQCLPDRIEIIRTIPKLTNGKIDYNRLSEYKVPRAIDSKKIDSSQTETEKALAKIWCTLLSLDHIDKKDNFFDVGGNSFLLVQLHTQLASLYAVSIEISELFTYSTIKSQANYIDCLVENNTKTLNKTVDNNVDVIKALQDFQDGKLDADILKTRLGLIE